MIRIALCDDSIKSYNHIKQCLQKYETVCHEHFQLQYYSTVEELLFSYQCQYDILMLETVINRKSGIETARSIRQLDEKVFIIFITMYRTFGPESYEVDAVNYLIKPISYQTLERAMNQIYAKILRLKYYIIVDHGNKLMKIPIDNILYITYFNHKLSFHLFSGETVESYGSYKRLFEHAGTDCLYQIHKSYVINMLWIERIHKKTIYIQKVSQGFLVTKQRWQSFIHTYKEFMQT